MGKLQRKDRGFFFNIKSKMCPSYKEKENCSQKSYMIGLVVFLFAQFIVHLLLIVPYIDCNFDILNFIAFSYTDQDRLSLNIPFYCLNLILLILLPCVIFSNPGFLTAPPLESFTVIKKTLTRNRNLSILFHLRHYVQNVT